MLAPGDTELSRSCGHGYPPRPRYGSAICRSGFFRPIDVAPFAVEAVGVSLKGTRFTAGPLTFVVRHELWDRNIHDHADRGVSIAVRRMSPAKKELINASAVANDRGLTV